MMNAIEGAVPTPQVQIVVHSRAGRQIFRDCPPLTSRTQNLHEPVDDFPHVHMAPIATTFSWRDQRPHMRPFLVGQIAGITQQASVVTLAILLRPHRRPPESGRSLESQTVPMNQIVLGRALRQQEEIPDSIAVPYDVAERAADRIVDDDLGPAGTFTSIEAATL